MSALAELDQARLLREVAEAQFVESRLVGRGTAQLVFVLILMTIFSLALIFPQTRGLLGLPAMPIVPMIIAQAVVTVIAMLVMRRRGPLSEAHLRMERIECYVSHMSALCFIFFSPSAISPYWIWIFMLLATGAPMVPLERFPVVTTALTLVALATAYLMVGRVADATTVALLGSSLVFLGARLLGEQHRSLKVHAENRALQAQLNERELHIERERISRELHDGVGAELTALVWRVRELLEGQQATAVESQTRRIAEELRTVIWDLRDDPGDWDSFVSRLERLGQNLTRGSGVDLELCVEGRAPERIDPERAHELVRGAQELLHNVVCHAEATMAQLRVVCERGVVQLEVIDDGVGVPEQLPHESGLAHVRARAERLGGVLVVEAAPGGGAGTRAAIRVPMEGIAAG